MAARQGIEPPTPAVRTSVLSPAGAFLMQLPALPSLTSDEAILDGLRTLLGRDPPDVAGARQVVAAIDPVATALRERAERLVRMYEVLKPGPPGAGASQKE